MLSNNPRGGATPTLLTNTHGYHRQNDMVIEEERGLAGEKKSPYP